jgi:hypothetical protein
VDARPLAALPHNEGTSRREHLAPGEYALADYVQGHGIALALSTVRGQQKAYLLPYQLIDFPCGKNKPSPTTIPFIILDSMMVSA